MKYWNQVPFLRLILPLLTGLLIAFIAEDKITNLLPAFVITASILLIMLLAFSVIKFFVADYNKRWIWGVLFNAFFVITGLIVKITHDDRTYDLHFKNNSKNIRFAKIVLQHPPDENDKTYKCIAEITSVYSGGKWHPSKGNALFYFEKCRKSELLKYGDCLIIRWVVTETKSPSNPSEFDYKRYLSYKNIFHQAYLPTLAWQADGRNEGNIIKKYSFLIRNNLLEKLRELLGKGREYAVASALLIGHTGDLDDELMHAFSAAGAMHVLSVSGLHVAIIFLILNYIFFFLEKRKSTRIMKIILVMGMLWMYSFVTGLSPAVLRAATMFSLAIAGKLFTRHTHVLNTLFSASFVLLIYDPCLLMSVGFQLSFLAVLGILILQEPVYQLWRPENYLLDKIWNLTSVSIAAQITTFPIGLYYFHQFPNYFIPANLVIIPLTTLIMYATISTLFISYLTPLAAYPARLCHWMISFLNKSVETTDDLPYAVTGGISISILQTLIIYLIIIFLLLYLKNRKAMLLSCCLLSIGLYIIASHQRAWVSLTQKKMIVYSISKTSCIDFIDGRKNLLFGDSSIISDKSKMNFHLLPSWWNLGLKENKIYDFRKIIAGDSSDIILTSFFLKDHFIQFYDKRMIFINDKKILQHQSNIRPHVHFAILSKNNKCNISEIVNRFRVDKIIIDSSNSRYRTKKWKEECNKLKIPYHVVSESGAFIVDL